MLLKVISIISKKEMENKSQRNKSHLYGNNLDRKNNYERVVNR